jgi:glycosyltransferase involved in cell wall biosynthesis
MANAVAAAGPTGRDGSAAATAARATTVLYVHNGGHWIRGSERCLLDLLAGVDRARFRPVLWCNGDGLAAAAADLGVSVERYDGAGAVAEARLPPARLVREARALIARYDVGLVHANDMVPVKWLLPAARSARIPLLAHLHLLSDRDARCFLGLHQVALAVGVSRAAVGGLLDDGEPAERVAVIYNGVSPARIERGNAAGLRASLGIPAAAVVSTAVTSLIPIKANDVLLDAFALLRRDAPEEHHLLLVGDGRERQALESRAASLGVADRVHFLGERPDAGAILRDATDVAVSASRMEAFPLNTLEAGYFALPVVASAIAAHRESVVDGETGILVPLDDAAAFANAVRALGADSGRRRALGDAGRARVRARFLVDRYVREFEDAYAALLARPAAAYGWIRGSVFPRVYARWLRERLASRLSRLVRPRRR